MKARGIMKESRDRVSSEKRKEPQSLKNSDI